MCGCKTGAWEGVWEGWSVYGQCVKQRGRIRRDLVEHFRRKCTATSNGSIPNGLLACSASAQWHMEVSSARADPFVHSSHENFNCDEIKRNNAHGDAHLPRTQRGGRCVVQHTAKRENPNSRKLATLVKLDLPNMSVLLA